MTRDAEGISLQDENLDDNKMQCPSYSVVEDDDIFFAATLLLSISNLSSLNSPGLSLGKKGPVRSCTLASKNSGWMSEEDLQSNKKKRRSTSHVSKSSEFNDRICAYCKCTETPMWRHGPPGFQNLCNKVLYLI